MDVTDGAFGADGIQPVQLPVALPPDLHGQLSSWCRRAAGELNVPALARGEVLEALLAELVTDPVTADAVRHRLLTRLGTRHTPAWSSGPRARRPRALDR